MKRIIEMIICNHRWSIYKANDERLIENIRWERRCDYCRKVEDVKSLYE